jgi:hypothetical protein
LEENNMSLTCYNYEAEMADFAGEWAQAIAAVISGGVVKGTLLVKHRTFQGKPAMVHEQCWKNHTAKRTDTCIRQCDVYKSSQQSSV